MGCIGLLFVAVYFCNVIQIIKKQKKYFIHFFVFFNNNTTQQHNTTTIIIHHQLAFVLFVSILFTGISDLLLQTMPVQLWLIINFYPSEFLVLFWWVVKVELRLRFGAAHNLPQKVFAVWPDSPRVFHSSDCIHNRPMSDIGWKGSAVNFLFIGRLTVTISRILLCTLVGVVLHDGSLVIWLYNIMI